MSSAGPLEGTMSHDPSTSVRQLLRETSSENPHRPKGARSAFSDAPLLPGPRQLVGSRLMTVPAALRWFVVVSANAAVQAFKGMSQGTLEEGEFVIGSSKAWTKAPSLGRDVSLEVLHGVIDDWQWCGDPSVGKIGVSRGDDRRAFRKLTKDARSYGGGSSGPNSMGEKDAQGREVLPKGALADGPLSELALPPAGFKPREACDLSEEVSYYFMNYRKLMLRKHSSVDWVKYPTTKTYWSPTYNTKLSKLQLCLRLYQAGMLGGCAVAESFVSMFTVVKGYNERKERSPRPVWDERGPNLLWRTPPWCSMGSPGCFACIDLSQLEPGMGLGSHVGDLPNYFYTLRLPRTVWAWFVIAGVSRAEFEAYAKSQGVTVNLEGQGQCLCVIVIMMGWSWAPFLAQTCLGALLDAIWNPGSSASRMIYRVPVAMLGTQEQCQKWNAQLTTAEEIAAQDPHRKVRIGDEWVTVQKACSHHKWSPDLVYFIEEVQLLTDLMMKYLTYAFIDDFGVFELVPLERNWEQQLQESATKSRAALVAKGFQVHKEQVSLGLENGLGVGISGCRPYVVRVSAEKARDLRGATRYALHVRQITGEEVEHLMGHWSWTIQVARSAYAIPHCTYACIHQERGEPACRLWDQVRAELWSLLVVSPFLKAELELPWNKTVFAGDSSTPAFGIVQTEASLEEIRGEARWAMVPGSVCAEVERGYSMHEREVWEPREPWLLRPEEDEGVTSSDESSDGKGTDGEGCGGGLLADDSSDEDEEMPHLCDTSGDSEEEEEMCDRLQAVELQEHDEETEERDSRTRRKGGRRTIPRMGKRAAPPMSKSWDPLDRWSLTWKGR